jgi:GT2 family glycosyltransferase
MPTKPDGTRASAAELAAVVIRTSVRTDTARRRHIRRESNHCAVRPESPALPCGVVEPSVAVVIPTRNRAEYLETTLRSLATQEVGSAYEVFVVDDGSSDKTREVAARWGAACIEHQQSRGINVARNAGVHASSASLIAFLDDDVYAPPGWLAAVLAGAARYDAADAFGGPIRAVFEGRAPRGCGREAPPITTLDLGRDDADADMVWGTNMAIRRRAFERFGVFDDAVHSHGDEEDWLLALRAGGGRIVYLSGAGVDHLRVGRDARLAALVRAAYARGRAARATDERRGQAPLARAELRTLAGCGWHAARYRCAQGPIMAAHSAGRLVRALRVARPTR